MRSNIGMVFLISAVLAGCHQADNNCEEPAVVLPSSRVYTVECLRAAAAIYHDNDLDVPAMIGLPQMIMEIEVPLPVLDILQHTTALRKSLLDLYWSRSLSSEEHAIAGNLGESQSHRGFIRIKVFHSRTDT